MLGVRALVCTAVYVRVCFIILFYFCSRWLVHLVIFFRAFFCRALFLLIVPRRVLLSSLC